MQLSLSFLAKQWSVLSGRSWTFQSFRPNPNRKWTIWKYLYEKLIIMFYDRHAIQIVNPNRNPNRKWTILKYLYEKLIIMFYDRHACHDIVDEGIISRSQTVFFPLDLDILLTGKLVTFMCAQPALGIIISQVTTRFGKYMCVSL